MTKMNAKTKKLLPLAFALFLAVGGVAGVMVSRFYLQRPAIVTILLNEYLGILWTDDTKTAPVTTIDFGSVVSGDPSSPTILETPLMYLELPNVLVPGEYAYATWNASGVPAGMTLTAEYDNNQIEPRFPWPEDTQTGDINEAAPFIYIKFTLNTNNHPEGTYGFQIGITIYEDT